MYKAILIILEPAYIYQQIRLFVIEECITFKYNHDIEYIEYTNIEDIILYDNFIHIRLFTSPFDIYIYIQNIESLHNCYEKLHAHMYKITENTYNPIHFNQTI